jgi:hypothetical protein
MLNAVKAIIKKIILIQFIKIVSFQQNQVCEYFDEREIRLQVFQVVYKFKFNFHSGILIQELK